MIESLSELNSNKIYAYLQSEDIIYSLNKNNLIGRNNNCNIVLNHPSIENEHAKIEIIDNDIFLIDLNSVNGTYLNNIKLEGNKLVKLKNKDSIKFGNYENNYVLQLNIDNNLSIELQNSNINNDNNNLISYFNNDPSINIKDNKISLVNDENYQYAKINHFNKNINNNNNNKLKQNENEDNNNIINKNNLNQLRFNTFDLNSSNERVNINNNNNDFQNNKNPIKEDFQIEENILNSNNNLNNNKINSIIQEENSEDEISTIKENNNNNNNKNIENSQFNLLEQTHKKNKILDKKLKEKIIEFQNLSNLYSQLNEKYNQLNSKHNSLMIYASELQNKNDFLTLNLKEKEIILKNFEDSELNKVIIEKNILINHLQEENEIYKNELLTIKKGLLDNNNNSNLSDNLNNLINDYLKQIIKYKQIINKYIAFETECTKKWNELIMANTQLKEKLESIDRNWNEDIKKFNDIIQNTDMRLNSALSQVPNNYGNFNIKKEEAAKFLVEQMNIYIQEKSNLLRENSELNKKLNLLSIENYQLKDEILKNELNNKNNDVNVLRNRIEELEDIIKQKDLINDPNKNIDYENIILKYNWEIKEKNILIEDFKNKIEEFKKNNNNLINFNDRDVINSMSKTLKEKDDLILNLKNQIINMNSKNNNTLN